MTAKNSDLGSFAQDVILGLSSNPKTLSSKYFYDAKGDKLFQQIMALPEYYLTRKEFEILEQQHEEILKPILDLGVPFNLVELGAGDGQKTKILLRYLESKQVEFSYFPIDFSATVLEELTDDLEGNFPNLSVTAIENTYRTALREKAWDNGRITLILFMGANLGNFQLPEAFEILDHLRLGSSYEDFVLIGLDLKKDPQTILNAYHDSHGVTEAFNLNLLHRINRELEADFNNDDFLHWPTYDPVSGECRSYLVSKKKQTVNVGRLDQAIHFEAFESIFMEVSKKYSIEDIRDLADRSGFKHIQNFTDPENFFVNTLWQKA
jgi:dimethylhistidine N-methyltransferase